ncbi:MAG: helix-turn-helix domain-containing protein, partial [Alphaproteobacteria bacterium]|nr:helix-turn-helix domain-containing protein [Alphaproteobacteria bacterium]
PGNIRQLQNVIRNIVVLHDAPLVSMTMMPPLEQVTAQPDQMAPMSVGAGVLPPSNRSASWTSPSIIQPSPMPLQTAAAQDLTEGDLRPMWIIEQEMIDRALELTGGNVNRAASLLEISPSSVYRKRTGK